MLNHTVMKRLRHEGERVILRDVMMAKLTTFGERVTWSLCLASHSIRKGVICPAIPPNTRGGVTAPSQLPAPGPPFKDKASREWVAAGLLNCPVL